MYLVCGAETEHGA